MNHKEMSRRVLAIVFVWGFWLFWIAGGIACLATYSSGQHHYSDRGPRYDYTGLWVGALTWLFISIFSMVFERWKYQKVSRRATYEFLLALVVLLFAVIPIISSRKDDIIGIAYVLLLAGLAYSCFRIRQVGLDYLAPGQANSAPQTGVKVVLSTPPYACHYH
jgi:cell division protein FtsW (lipid II flippase)